ncbi:phage Gp37/Gp68 family protein, partial [bacterium]|nr:phage Gp37/Gp68 family protein [bacterium]
CKFCYAERFAHRLQLMGQKKYANGFDLTLHPELLSEPYSWKKPRVVFVNSMSDLFHEQIPTEFIKSVFDVMNDTPQHIYQILTKRPQRMVEIADKLSWSDNVWIGVSVETSRYYSRIDLLRQIPANTRFLSLEPLLGPMKCLNLKGINWVIVGGESGPNARPMKEVWVRSIREQCLSTGVPFFFKQWGGTNKKAKGRELDGQIWDEMPNMQIQPIQ